MSESKKTLSEKLDNGIAHDWTLEDLATAAAEARALEERVAELQRMAVENRDWRKAHADVTVRAEAAEAEVVRELERKGQWADRALKAEAEVARLQEQWEWEASCRAKVLTENDALRAKLEKAVDKLNAQPTFQTRAERKLEKVEAYVAKHMTDGWNYTDHGHAISLILDGEGSDEDSK